MRGGSSFIQWACRSLICNLGPSQTARSLKGFDRRQVSWVNQHHITEEKLDEAIRSVITGYNRFHLPKYWGTGKRASADGTKWEMYEQNLLAEYHIRYGGYGGIGYYHVSDTYIALFSRFIPCGVHEGSFILDMFEKEEESIRPDTVHGDTHAQSTTVFGLAHLLGISLMPRIKNWKDLTLYRPDPASHYTHLDSLFTDTIDWDLIATHLPDMIRVALSIKAGKITPSTILRKLGTYSRRNKLYQAFQELGRVIRTHFLLSYLGDPELRSTIQSATNTPASSLTRCSTSCNRARPITNLSSTFRCCRCWVSSAMAHGSSSWQAYSSLSSTTPALITLPRTSTASSSATTILSLTAKACPSLSSSICSRRTPPRRRRYGIC